MCMLVFIAASFIIGTKSRNNPIDELLNKMKFIYTMEHYLAIKRNEILIHVMTLDKP